jgi:hypothetical protein
VFVPRQKLRSASTVLALTLIATMLASPATAGARAMRTKHPDLGKCALKRSFKLFTETPEVVVSWASRTSVVGDVSVSNTVYSTCLRRTGERHQLYADSSDPSPDAGYVNQVAALRAAGDYVLFVSSFTQDNPDGSTTGSAEFHLIDVADHNHTVVAIPDPNYGLIGFEEIAVSTNGFIGWAQINVGSTAVTETVEADTGSGPVAVATAPIPDTLTFLPFHNLAFHGETLTWTESQSARLTQTT